MQITYKTKKLKDICVDASVATKKYGLHMAEKIHKCVDQIAASSSIEEMLQFRIGKCHLLTNNRKGQYAMHLVEPYRLVFTVDKDGIVQIANIIDIVDYH